MERYLNYNTVLKNEFSERVQKISINAGFTCPNRDGSKGTGGCTYCNNQTFSPEYCKPTSSISKQIEEGIDFFRYKYQNQYYLAYLQSYTNTYTSFDKLKSLYEEALSYPQIVGLVIGTRPDCVNDELLDYLAELSERYYIMLEYGVESTRDETIKLINRGHDYACCVEAIQKTAEQKIRVGAHLILGLPKENRADILAHADELSKLPLTTLKLHQLQIIRGTKMAEQYAENPDWFHLYEADEYIDLAIDFIERLNPNIAIERFLSQSPAEFLIAPDWGLKNYEFVEKIRKRLQERDTYQGRIYDLGF
jgi:radical SAM protein (TIGR01212 family)